MVVGTFERHMATPASKVPRSLVNTPMLIVASAKVISQLAPLVQPVMTSGAKLVVQHPLELSDLGARPAGVAVPDDLAGPGEQGTAPSSHQLAVGPHLPVVVDPPRLVELDLGEGRGPGVHDLDRLVGMGLVARVVPEQGVGVGGPCVVGQLHRSGLLAGRARGERRCTRSSLRLAPAPRAPGRAGRRARRTGGCQDGWPSPPCPPTSAPCRRRPSTAAVRRPPWPGPGRGPLGPPAPRGARSPWSAQAGRPRSWWWSAPRWWAPWRWSSGPPWWWSAAPWWWCDGALAPAWRSWLR